ncbi:hypothetical protein F5984_25635 [Rudanella paleaurantiibacter]|uniref:Uncharacterized protein n=1 Tax=Rudanella paleaurantiibacter TaxID=2614655 RepID=A0A7J5TU06_9BACT|nr:hypothetical protein [Rudanella paleaurantiibacter]KAB7725705.1 hypothetical protein F5984_25635 [Rudanella paleaurantiibacter]
MDKPINNKVDALRNEAENQEELMKSLAKIDEEGQLTDDVLDAVSGGTLSKGDLKTIIGIEPIGIMPIGMMPEPDVMPLPGTITL